MVQDWQPWNMAKRKKIRTHKATERKAKELKPLELNQFQRVIADHILVLVSQGYSVNKAEKKLKISSGSVADWARADGLFLAELSRARELQAAFLAEQTVEIADSNRDPAKVRNMLAARQWLAGKHNKHYSDKLTIDANVKHEHYLEQLELPPHMKAHMIDATPQRIPLAASECSELTAQGNLNSEGEGSENLPAGGASPNFGAGPGGGRCPSIPDQFSKKILTGANFENKISSAQTATQEQSL